MKAVVIHEHGGPEVLSFEDVPTPGAANTCVVCSLAPASARRDPSDSHTVTATVLRDRVDPVAGAEVLFEVVSGPNAGATGTVATDAAGMAAFTYSGSTAGIDILSATGSDGPNAFACSATADWFGEDIFADGFESP